MAKRIDCKTVLMVRVSTKGSANYASLWGEKLLDLLSTININTVDLSFDDVSTNSLGNEIQPDKKPAAVIYYGHGSEPEGYWLDKDKVPFLNENSISLLKGCFVYSVSCFSFGFFERTHNESNIRAAVGYKGNFKFTSNNTEFLDLFERCSNAGIKKLLTDKEAQLDDIMRYMKDEYNRCISYLFDLAQNHSQKTDFLPTILFLNSNLDQLDSLGVRNTTISVR